MAGTVGYERNGKISKRLSKSMEKRLASARDRLKHGMDYRRDLREEHWRTSVAQYSNLTEWQNHHDDEMDVVNVNISFSTINTLVPYVADENPKFVVEPYSGDATPENSSLLEFYLNRLWRSPEMEGQENVRPAVWDYLVYGDGYEQVTWRIKEEKQRDAEGNVIQGRGIELVEYGVERVSPWDLWIDPYSDGIHNARWVCRRILVPLEELKSDDRYKVTEDLSGGGTAASTDSFDPEDEERIRSNQDWIAVYEFYDRVDDWMLAFTMSGNAPVRFIEGTKCPITQLGNYRIASSPYHIGELEMISSLQDELNRTRSEMITHRRRNIAKWLVRDNEAVGEKAIQAMKSGIINDVIPVQGNEPFDLLVKQLTPQGLSSDSYAQDGIIRNDINEITGVNEYLRGAPPDISRTATEASIIEGATNVRTRHKLNQVEAFLRRLGQSLLDVIADTIALTDFEEMRLYVTGAEAEKLSRAQGMDANTDLIFTPSNEIFQGKYVVNVERGSAELRNPQVREQRYKEMTQILLSSQPIFQQIGLSVNVKHVMELWFKEAGIEDVDAMFVNDDFQQAQQQMGLMERMQGLASQGGPGSPVATGSATPAGQPREVTSRPPDAAPTPANSGMLEPR